jgi:hypothetical protein
MRYFEMNNTELLNAYNASAEYDSEMCKEICARVGMKENYYNADGDSIDCIMERAVERLLTTKGERVYENS